MATTHLNLVRQERSRGVKHIAEVLQVVLTRYMSAAEVQRYWPQVSSDEQYSGDERYSSDEQYWALEQMPQQVSQERVATKTQQLIAWNDPPIVALGSAQADRSVVTS